MSEDSKTCAQTRIAEALPLRADKMITRLYRYHYIGRYGGEKYVDAPNKRAALRVIQAKITNWPISRDRFGYRIWVKPSLADIADLMAAGRGERIAEGH